MASDEKVKRFLDVSGRESFVVEEVAKEYQDDETFDTAKLIKHIMDQMTVAYRNTYTDIEIDILIRESESFPDVLEEIIEKSAEEEERDPQFYKKNQSDPITIH